MRSVVKLPEKKELSGEPEKDKSKVRSKKPTNAVSTPCLPAAACFAGISGSLWGV